MFACGRSEEMHATRTGGGQLGQRVEASCKYWKYELVKKKTETADCCGFPTSGCLLSIKDLRKRDSDDLCWTLFEEFTGAAYGAGHDGIVVSTLG